MRAAWRGGKGGPHVPLVAVTARMRCRAATTGSRTMGLTAASLHLLQPSGLEDPAALVAKAYAKLGWAPPKRGEDATRRVLLRDAGDWIALEDSAWAATQDGTLQDLAALLSRAAGSAAVVATVVDSDAFTFLLYDKGRQVDAAGDDLAEADVAMVRGKRQATLWAKAMAPSVLRRAFSGMPPLLPEPKAFLARATAAAALESAFAEDRLAAWRDLAGIPVVPGPVIAEVGLVARPGAAPAAGAAPKGRSLRVFDAPDDCPWHEFQPAPWPCAPNATTAYRWLVTCAGGGIDGASLHLDIDRSDGAGFALREVHLRAHPFFNGQMISMTPLAEWTQAVAGGAGLAENAGFDLPDFVVRAPAAGSRSQAVLILRVTVAAPASGEATIRPVLHVAGEAVPLALPRLRLRATPPDWVPVIAQDMSGPMEAEALLRLNAPSLRTAVAVLAESPAARPAIRTLFDRLLGACTGAVATLSTEKFMTPSAHVGKARYVLPLAELAGAKPWAAVFDPAARIQTARLDLSVGEVPLAGLVLQASLRDGTEDADGTVTAALWLKPECAAALGLDPEALLAAFRGWMDGAAPLQGWEADCAWLPRFDRAESYEHTPYEILGTSAAARMRIHDAANARAWRLERLKYVAPRLWLGPVLAARIDGAALERVAEVAPRGAGVAIALRSGQPLTALEAALRPILPEAR